jgi:hypothetical protein
MSTKGSDLLVIFDVIYEELSMDNEMRELKMRRNGGN